MYTLGLRFLTIWVILYHASSKAFLEDQLPLELVRITPGEQNLSLDEKPESAFPLKGSTPFTVIFSRPVIALGSDWGADQLNEMPIDKIPFTLTLADGSPLSSKVSGKFRWPTTYTARFDPDYNWPTDLDILLTVNPLLTTYDGVRVSNPNKLLTEANFVTDKLTGQLAEVTSEQAKELTGGKWDPYFASNHYKNMPKHLKNKPEVPPDGKIRLTFNQGVSKARLHASLRLVSSLDENNQQDFEMEDCEPSNVPIPYNRFSFTYSDADKKQASTDPTCHLVVPKPRGLQPQTAYSLVLPKGSLYNEFSGPTKQDMKFDFTGLQPFEFVPVSKNQVEGNAWELFLIHGLQAPTDIRRINERIRISNSKRQPVNFELVRPKNSSLRIKSQFRESEQYKLNFQSAQLVDGFGQPLATKSIRVTTKKLSEFFDDIKAGSGTLAFEKSKFEWDSWKVFTRGSEDIGLQTKEKSLSTGPIRGNQIGYALGSLVNRKVAYPYLNSTLQWDTSDLEFKVQDVAIPSSTFLVQQFNPGYYPYAAQIVSVTNFAVSALRTPSSLLVWVTSFDTGSNVEGAKVEIFEQPSVSWGSTDLTNAKVLYSGVTGKDGLMEWTGGNMASNYHVVASKDGQRSMVQQYFYASSSNRAKASIITDRAVYKPGDTVYLTTYMRVLEGTQLRVPTEETASESELSVQWARAKAPDWKALSGSVPVEWDGFGAFTTELKIPLEATSGSKSIRLTTIATGYKYKQTPATASIKIADPRRPTATMEFSGESPVLRSTAPAYQLTTTVMTGTGQPIAGAAVEVSCTYSVRSVKDGSVKDEKPPVCDTFTMTTDESGSAQYDFKAGAGSNMSANVREVCFKALWVGPTGELIQKDYCADVRASEWTITTTVSPDPIPGVPFGVRVNVVDAHSNQVMGEQVQVTLFDGSSPIAECTASSDGGIETQCFGQFKMPQPQIYFLVATVTDNVDQLVESNTTLGRSLESYQKMPLKRWGGASALRTDKTVYKQGDTAEISFDTPFVGGSLLVRYYQAPYTKTVQYPVPRQGTAKISIPITEKGCKLGCTVGYVYSVPRQPTSFASIPDSLPVSSELDLYEPRFSGGSLTLEVEDESQLIHVDVETAESTSPGSTVDISLKLRDAEGQPVTGEVALYVVDQAFLDLVPHPQTNLPKAFNVYSPESLQVSDSRSQLVPFKLLSDKESAISRRIAQDPWLTPSKIGNIDESDEDFFNSRTSWITEHDGFRPQIYAFNSHVQRATGKGKGKARSARSAPMAMAAKAVPVEYAAVQMSDEGSAGSYSPPAPSAGDDVPVRSKFEIVPLFIGNLLIDSTDKDGKTVPLTLPGNIGKFSIRAYAVDSRSASGQNETSIVVTKDVNLQPMFPRFARTGDQFESGVIVAADDSKFDKDVKISVQSLDNSLGVDGPVEQIVRVQGTTPVQVRFDMTAAAVGDTQLKFTATALDTTPDAFKDGFKIEPTQDAVTVGTSMAITANAEGTPWEEAIDMPAMLEGTGTLGLAASVGRFAAVQANANSIFESSQKQNTNAYLWVAMAMMEPAMATYLNADTGLELDSVASALSTLTHDSLGLRYSVVYPPYPWTMPSFSLNSEGIFAAMMGYLQRQGNLGGFDPVVERANTNEQEESVLTIPEESRSPFTVSRAERVERTPSPEERAAPSTPQSRAERVERTPSPEERAAPSPQMASNNNGRGNRKPRGLLQFRPSARGPRNLPVAGSTPLEDLEPRDLPPLKEHSAPKDGPAEKNTPEESEPTISNDLLSVWSKAASDAMTYSCWRPQVNQQKFYAWDDLAKSIMLFGLDWRGSNNAPNIGDWTEAQMARDCGAIMNLQELAKNVDKLSSAGQAYYVLAFLLRPDSIQQRYPKELTLVPKMISNTQSRMRLQGRTAYIQRDATSAHASPMTTQALWLMILARSRSEDVMTEKLANYVSQGGSPYGWPRWGVHSTARALASLALGMYDLAVDNTSPNVKLGVRSGTQLLLSSQFTSPSDPVAKTTADFDSLPRSPRETAQGVIVPMPINFLAKGVGEVSTVLVMDFVPAEVSADPIYRGIYVERVINHIQDRDVLPGSTQLRQAGQFVKVTIQITTPDDLVGVEVADLLPGGLEALDPNLQSGATKPPAKPPIQPRYGRIWNPAPFGPRSTLADRVKWTANFLPAGTHTLTYEALAVTPGVFLHPPTKANVAAQPELLGLSGGGYFVVTEEHIPQDQEKAYLTDHGIPIYESTIATSCDEECGEREACNVRTGKCEEVIQLAQVSLQPRSARKAMYQASVAVSSSGEGDQSKAPRVTVTPTRNNNPVRFLKVYQQQPRSITLTWVMPDSPVRQCKTFDYKVRHKAVGPKSKWKTATVSEEFIVIQDLRPNTKYVFEVSPTTADDFAWKSKRIRTRTRKQKPRVTPQQLNKVRKNAEKLA